MMIDDQSILAVVVTEVVVLSSQLRDFPARNTAATEKQDDRHDQENECEQPHSFQDSLS